MNRRDRRAGDREQLLSRLPVRRARRTVLRVVSRPAPRARSARGERDVAAHVLFVWGILWWVGGGLHEIDHHVGDPYRVQAALLFFTGSCVAFSRLHTRLDWRAARYAALAQLPLMIGSAIAAVERLHASVRAHRLDRVAACVRRAPARAAAPRERRTAAINTGCTPPASGCSLRSGRGRSAGQIDHLVRGRAVWPLIAFALVPGRCSPCSRCAGRVSAGRSLAHRDAYLVAGSAPLAVFLALWAFLVNFAVERRPVAAAVRADPEPARPRGSRRGARRSRSGSSRVAARARPSGVRDRVAGAGCGLCAAAAFVWVNVVLLRTLHHWAGVPFDLDAHAALRSRPDVVLDPLDADRARHDGARDASRRCASPGSPAPRCWRRGREALRRRPVQRRHDRRASCRSSASAC